MKDSGLRDARRGPILIVALRHCEARSSPGHDLTDKSTIIWWNDYTAQIIFEIVLRFACLVTPFSPTRRIKIRQLAEWTKKLYICSVKLLPLIEKSEFRFSTAVVSKMEITEGIMIIAKTATVIKSYSSLSHLQSEDYGHLNILSGNLFSKDFAVPKHFEEIRHEDKFFVIRQSCNWVE